MSDSEFNGTRVSCLGRFVLEIDGRPVKRWRGGRARSLFQYLLVNRNKLVLKERLYEVLWPHAEWSPNSSSLKVAVHALRQVLAVQKGQPLIEVIYQDFGYLLHVDPAVWIDFHEFEKLVAEAAAAEVRRETAAAARAYARAVSLYRGNFLVGESADWVDEQREWLRSSVLRALTLLADDALRRGDDDLALEYCRLSLGAESCREEAYRTIMLVHASRGELGQVQRWYGLCADRLQTQLGIGPSPETQRLLAETLGGVPRVVREAGRWPATDEVLRRTA